jgi:deoxycytidylate deaminase
MQAIAHNFNDHHAEVNALQQLWPSKRVGTKVYSFRWRRDGTLGMAKPCPKCEKYMRDNGVKIVFYSDNTGQIKKMKL